MTVATASDGPLPRWQRSLLPAMLGADHADRGQSGASQLPRSARDWLVDIVIFLGALALGIAALVANHKTAGTPLFVADIALGVPSLAALWVRRSRPLAVGLVTILANTVSGLAGGAEIAALFTAAIYCPPRRTLQLLALSLAVAAVYPAVHPHADGGYATGSLLFGVALNLVAAVLGAFVRARRELVLSLHERNRRLVDEQARRVQEAQLAERYRIAREMHDVLAHRISLLSVHAGALEFHPDASPEEIARAAEVIRVSARAAQEELREVIGVLRAGSPESASPPPVEPPQPTIADLTMLVAESRNAGMDVRLTTRLEAEALPPTVGRTVHRLVQEALTNVRKHAPGQVVIVEISGHHAVGVTVDAVNRPVVGRRPPAADAAPVSSGTGLIGLGERVALAGGRLEHAPLPGGGFRLHAVLPWPAER